MQKEKKQLKQNIECGEGIKTMTFFNDQSQINNQIRQLGSQQISYNRQYYQQYKQLYSGAIHLSSEMEELVKIRQQLFLQLSSLQKKTNQFRDIIRGQPKQKKKRTRRQADEIQRYYVCNIPNCQKSYGTQGSLIQHIKKKHPQLSSKGDFSKNQSS